MKKSLLFGGLAIISTDVLGMNNKLFFGNIECSQNPSVVQYTRSQNSNSLAERDAPMPTDKFYSVMTSKGLVLVVPSNRELSPGEIEEQMTKGLKTVLADMQRRRKNDELTAQLIQQIHEYCERNIWQQQEIDQLQQENIRQQNTINQLRQENIRQQNTIDQLQQQVSEISVVNKENPLMLGNTWLIRKNRELSARNASLEKLLQKSEEFSSPKLNGRKK